MKAGTDMNISSLKPMQVVNQLGANSTTSPLSASAKMKVFGEEYHNQMRSQLNNNSKTSHMTPTPS